MFVVGVKFRSAMYMVGEGDGSVTVILEASKEHANFDFVIQIVTKDATAQSMGIHCIADMVCLYLQSVYRLILYSDFHLLYFPTIS